MKKLNKYILFLGVALLTPSLLFAQKKDDDKKILSERVEVVKDYVPKIGKASKRDITPTEEDNVQIAIPKLKYSIGYKPEKYPFKINYLEIPSYKIESEPVMYNGYADLMLGGPLSSRANVSYTTSPQRYMIAGASLSHYGYFGKLTNDVGQKLSATQSTNNLSLYLDYQKDNLKFKALAMQNYNLYSRYGYNFEGGVIPENFNDKNSLKQHFLQSTINVEIGTSFLDINKFNTKFYGSFNTISDKYKFNESLYQAGILLSKGFKKINSLLEGRIEYLSVIPSGRFTLVDLVGEARMPVVGEDVPPSGENFEDVYKMKPSGILSIAPRYVFTYKNFNIDLGVNMIFDTNGNKNNYKQGSTEILPEVEVSYSLLSGAFRPYAKVDGEYINNNYSSLVRMNPYIEQGMTAPNSVVRRYMFGIRGIIAPFMYYNVYGGLRQSRDQLMFVNFNQGNTFTLMRDDFDNLEIGAEVGYILNSVLNFSLDLKYIDYDNTGVTEQIAYGYAPFTASIGVNIHPTKKLSLSVNGRLLSSRTFATQYKIDSELLKNEVGAVFDLSFGAEYKITKRLAASVKAENLLNQKLYPYNNYRGIGINILGGVSFKF